MTTFHPDSQWLFEYVAGTLDDSQALCVSTHLSYCSQCKSQVAHLTSVGGAMFSSDTLDNDACPDSSDTLARVVVTNSFFTV